MEKVLRSLIQEKFSLDVRLQIELLSRRRDIINKEKQEELIKILQSNNIAGVVPLGPGTNRYAFKLDGFVIKVATDHDGKIDNMKEFKMAKRLYPYVTKTYEVSENGTILVAEYIQPFESYAEMCRYADKIRAILTKLSAVYLIGDVGITNKNYSNWGLRVGTEEPVCLDFAYIYEVSSELFICRHCNTNSILLPNKDFTELYCSNPACGKRYLFEDIRARIGNDVHAHEIGDLSEEGYALQSSFVKTTLDPERSNYLIHKKDETKKEKKHNNALEGPVEYDNFIMDDNPNNMEDTKMKNAIISTVITPNTKIQGNVIRGTILPEVPDENRKDLQNLNNAIDEFPDNLSKAFSSISVTVEDPEEDSVEPNDLAFECDVEEDEKIEEPEVSNSQVVVQSSVIDFGITNKNYSNFGLRVGTEEPAVTAKPSVVAEVLDEIQNTHDDIKSRNNNDSIASGSFIFKDQFVKNIVKAISKISNKVGNSLYEALLYDDVKSYLREKMYPEAFYKNVQNAVFKSITEYCNFEEVVVENTNKNGTHKESIAPENLYDPKYVSMLRFIEKFWINRKINELDKLDDIKSSYNEYSDYPWGFSYDWLEVFKNRLKLKMQIDKKGYEIIANRVAELWCLPKEDSVDDLIRLINSINQYAMREFGHEVVFETTPLSAIPIGDTEGFPNTPDKTLDRIIFKAIADAEKYKISGYLSDNKSIVDDKLIFESSFNGVKDMIDFFYESTFEDILSIVVTDDYDNELREFLELILNAEGETIIIPDNNIEVIDNDVSINDDYMNIPEPNDDDDDSDEEIDDDEEDCDDEELSSEYLSVRIDQESDFDIVRIMTSEAYGDVSIPIYTLLQNLDDDKPASVVDERNGVWDWLIHLVPDMMFTTYNPEKYMQINSEVGDYQAKIVILNIAEDGKCVMGIYYIASIKINDEDGNEFSAYDDDLLFKLNKVICENIAFTNISHLKRSLTMKDLIKPEEYFATLFDKLSEDDNLNYKDDIEVSEAEDAAVSAMMTSSNANNDIDEIPVDTEVESKSEVGPDVEDQYSEYEDDNQVTFQPIRRKRN